MSLFKRCVSLCLVLGFCAAPAAIAQGSGPFNATFTFGRIAAELSDDCAFPLAEPSANLQFGTIQFLADGSFSASGTEHLACAFAAGGSSPFTVPGSYSLASDGDLVLDFDPLNPGVEIEHFQMSLDRQLFMAQTTVDGEPGLLVAVRRSSGMSDASFNGDYALGSVALEVAGAGWTTAGSWGSLNADGSGGFTTAVVQRELGPAGAVLSTPGVSAGYSLAANGTLSLGGVPVGALSADASFGFFVDWSAPDFTLSCLVRNANTAPAPGFLHGDWHVANFGGEQPVPNSSTEQWEGTGVAMVDGGTGAFNFVGVESWVDLTGGGGGPDVGIGFISSSGTGALAITDSGTFAHSGWLTPNEELVLFAMINDPSEVSLGLLIRGQPALGTAYCFGDGSGTPCPCNNDNDGSRVGGHAGCANGAFAGGAVLGSYGTTSVLANDLVLAAAGLVPGQPGLLFQAQNAVNGGAGVVFGDGLRCAGGNVDRLSVLFPDVDGLVDSSAFSVSQFGSVSAGDLRRYQVWYRDPQTSPCGNDFNLSNGLELTWVP